MAKEIKPSQRVKAKKKAKKVKQLVDKENRRPRRKKKKKASELPTQMKVVKPPKISDEAVVEQIMTMVREAGAEGSVKPEHVAMALLPEHWQTIKKRVRLTAVQLARKGDIVILRKGQVVDPDDFKGLYRLRIN